MKPLIKDHDHEWETRGRWRTGKCSACGDRVSNHLSYQEEFERILDKLGAVD
jgi:hypothetical protein